MGSDSHGYGARGIKSLLSVATPAVVDATEPMVVAPVSGTVASCLATAVELAALVEAKAGPLKSLRSYGGI